MSVVAIARDKDIDAMVRRAVSLLGGIEDTVRHGDKVLIKPNLSCAKSSETGATTDPRLVSSTIRLVKEAGGTPVVGESPISGYDMEKVFEVTGVRKIAEREGAMVVNFDRDEPVEVSIPGAKSLRKVKIAKTVLDCDGIIGLPKLKTHFQTVVTLSLKNMKGIIWANEKYKSHIVGLHQAIADLNSLFKPRLVVIDGTIGMEGIGPTSGSPVRMDLVLASKDPVAADAVACTVMGFMPEKIKHITLAAEAGLGVMDLNRIEIVGEPIEKIARRFEPPDIGLKSLIENSPLDRVLKYFKYRSGKHV